MYARRGAWWDGRPAPPSLKLRAGFEALVGDYLGLDEADFTVRSETDSAIFRESRNPCPTLSACETLGLDTRVVCRRISEKPTQAFLSRLDPCLRFVRDYSPAFRS